VYAKLQVVDNCKEPLLFTRHGLSSVNVYSHEDYWVSKDGICLKHELGLLACDCWTSSRHFLDVIFNVNGTSGSHIILCCERC